MKTKRQSKKSHNYKYGFQGQERDEETGWDNYKYRMHDPRLGRFFAVDPLAHKFAFNSPYCFAENKLGMGKEYEGAELEIRMTETAANSKPVQKILNNSDFSDVDKLSSIMQLPSKQGIVVVYNPDIVGAKLTKVFDVPKQIHSKRTTTHTDIRKTEKYFQIDVFPGKITRTEETRFPELDKPNVFLTVTEEGYVSEEYLIEIDPTVQKLANGKTKTSLVQGLETELIKEEQHYLYPGTYYGNKPAKGTVLTPKVDKPDDRGVGEVILDWMWDQISGKEKDNVGGVPNTHNQRDNIPRNQNSRGSDGKGIIR